MAIAKKTIISRTLATILILLVTVALSLFSYATLWENEEEHCWEVLGDSAKSISREIVVRMEDNCSILRLAAGALTSGGELGSYEEIIRHVNEYLDMTMFSRIDIILPDDTILMYDGSVETGIEGSSFDELVRSGEHLSHRVTDSRTGRESVYCNVPVRQGFTPVAILVGVIDCTELSDYFRPTVYDGEAGCMIVDRNDGSIIADNVLYDFGNVYEIGEVKTLEGYDGIDLIDGIRNARSGVIAYESLRTGENCYMYYTPVEDTSWQLLVTVAEELAFSRHTHMRSALVATAIIESAVVVLFVIMNFLSINQLAKSKTESERQLHKSNTLVECVTELSSYSNIDLAIDNLLGIINRYFDGDRTYLCDVDYENQTTSNTYEFAADGISREIDNLQNVPLSAVQAWLDEFERTGIFYISNIDRDLEITSNTYDILSSQDIQSLIAVPLMRGNVITGYMGVDNPRKNYEDLTLMSSVQFFVTEAIDRKSTQDALTHMSYTDTLTRLHNRNRFNHVCDEYLRHPRSRVGVAFFDLDGLKQMNDSFGHDAGDRLIVSTADNIRSMFSGNSYRIGGDEFAVILPDVDEKEFDIQVDRVRNLMKKNDISVAIGVSWHEHCTNIKEQLKEADERMYVEKAEHRRLRAEAAQAAADAAEKSAGN